MPNLPKSFTLAHIDSSGPEDFPRTDAFTLLGDGVGLFRITFEWDKGGIVGNMTARLEMLQTEITPELLPFIYNGFHLIATVEKYLADRISATGNEFYHEEFYNDDGQRVELPIDFYGLVGVQ